MPPADLTLRRATLDDLEALRGLWRECRQPEFELEKRFTEFQIAVDPHGWIVGALGVRAQGQHAEVHHLALRSGNQADGISSLLWERILDLANQFQAHRLWTRESGPFWTGLGFVPPDAVLRELPPRFGHRSDAWLTLKLREDPLRLIAAEEQLEAFLELERLKTERLVRRGQILKLVATLFAAILLALSFGALFLLFRRRRAGS
jgi:N-acetylglutamate synthase-like GNAT family acetyltransferase